VKTPESDRPDDIEAQIRELLGVGLFRTPPDGFDPLTAKARELRAYGYPARPDAERQPRLHAQWERLLSQPIRMIEPRFAPIRDKAHGSRTTYGLPAGNGWGGAISWAPKDDTITFVSGQWTVPHIVSPKPGDSIVANWIGIDGANDDPHGRESYDILQCGTTQLVIDPLGIGTIYESFAWFEWYPASPVEISNFRVSPGDTMSCVICVYSPTEAGIHLLNVTTGIGTAFTKIAPKKTSLLGNCAEWVIEDPVSSGMRLGRFGETFFDECVAGTQGGALLLGGDGSLLPMYDINGKDIAIPERETDVVVKIRYADQAP
jgi:hypothetical protein